MKAGWEIKALGEVATIINGGTPKSEVAAYWDGDIDWLTPKDMGKLDGHLVHVTPRRISREGLAKCSARQVPTNSVIMSTRAPIGHLAMNTVPMAFNQGCRGMVPSENLDAKYLFYVLSANVQALDDLGTGTTFKELSAGSLKAFPIPLPPLDKQKRIVEVLDAAFEGLSRARAHTETNLQNARELFELVLADSISVAEQQFGTAELGDHCDFRNGFAFESSKFTQHGEPILRISNIQDGSIDATKMVFTNAATYKEDLTRYEVQPGDLLIAMSGATTGKVGFNRTDQVYLQNQRVGRFCPTQSLKLEFLYHFLTTKIEENLAISAGAAQPNLSTKQIKDIRLPVPALRDQEAFLDKISALEAETRDLQSHYRAKLADLDALRQVLLQKAFAGELT